MEILGYLYTAVDYEEATNADNFANGDDDSSVANYSLDPALKLALPSLSWVRTSSLGISALLCTLSLFMGIAPNAAALMRNGDSGVDVTALQQELARLGYFNTQATGYFGSITQAAVEDFQRANGLVVDGIVGPATEAALRARTASPAVVNQARPTPAVITAPPPTVVSNSVSQGQLIPGASGPSVTRLQTQLTQVGVYQGPITGFYGPLTQAAVTRFQQLNGLVASGVADSPTLAALNRSLRGVETVMVETVEMVPMVTPQRVTRRVAPQVIVETVPQPVVTQPSVERVVVVPGSNQEIYLGDSGQAVRQLQQTLAELRFYEGPITGYYGALTKDAVTRFQETAGIDADGVTGAMTWQALLNATII